MNLFTLMATIGLDTTEFEAGVRKSTQTGQGLATGMTTKMHTMSVAVGNFMANMATAATRALAQLPGAAIEAAAEVQAENAAFASSFGDLAGEATKSFKAIGAETNILSTRLQAVGTKGYSQLKGAGLDANDALTQSERLLRIAADAAAYYDISLEDADTRIRSFMRGNTEAGDAIGLFTSESQRNSYALETYGVKWQDLTEAQRQMLMLDVAEDIYKQSGAIGQAAREGSSWANVTANLQEAWRQTLATVGAPLMESFTPFLEKVTAWLSDEATQTKLADFAGKLGEIAALVFTELMEAFDWIVNNGKTVGTIVAIIAGGFLAFQLAVNPLGTAIELVTAGLVALVANWEDISKAIDTAIEKVKEFLGLNDITITEYGAQGGTAAGYDAFNAWAKAKQSGDKVGETSAWMMVETAVGGAEIAQKLKEEFETYSASTQLEIDADIPEEWYTTTFDSLQSGLDSMDLTVDPALQETWSTDRNTDMQGFLDGTTLLVDPALQESWSTDRNTDMQGFLDLMTLEIDPELEANWKEIMEARFQKYANNMHITVPVDFSPSASADGSHAKGLGYVPWDNYLAILHRGEEVLSAQKAEQRRNEQSGSASASGKQVTVNQYIDAVPQTPSEIAFETANALRMLRFNV